MAAFKTFSRPLTNMMVKTLKRKGKESKLKQFFVIFGQQAHRFEVRMNRFITAEQPTHQTTAQISVDDHDVRFYIKPLSEDAAFNKGVEWSSDIFFFYTMLLAFGLYEIHKAQEKDQKAAKLTKEFQDCLNAQKEEADKIEEQLRKAKEQRAHNTGIIHEL